MSRPVLLAVEDDPEALRAVEAELRERYARDYAVVCEGSTETALRALERFASDGEDVALVLAGQWLKGMTGSELLQRVHQLHPHAKRGLLIEWGGWGDPPTGEAIFDAMAHGKIDYYVLRPSWTPDEVFHSAVSGFLLEWSHSQRTAPHTIYVIGESWSGRAYELRDVLERCAIPHAFCLADSEKGAAAPREGRRRPDAARDRPSQRPISAPTRATRRSRPRPARRWIRARATSTW